MSLLTIYNPYILPNQPKIIEFVVGYADSMAIGTGTDEFINGLIQDIGVETEAVKWTLNPFRSTYYSDFGKTDDWRLKWVINWKVRVELAENANLSGTINSPVIETNAFDVSWLSAKFPGDESILRCYVIADFESEAHLKQAQNSILEFIEHNSDLPVLKSEANIGFPIFTESLLLGKYCHLEIDLGEFPSSFFRDGADYAERIVEICRQNRGSTNYQNML